MAPYDKPETPIIASRRDFLAGAAGLVIAVSLPVRARAHKGGHGPSRAAFAPNAFVRVAPDNIITVLIKNIEFGQGPWTGLATLVAEEMDADWGQIRAEHAPSNPALYSDPMLGMQLTGGSASMATSYDLMRKAGATARAMLVAAAAKAWGVPAGEIAVDKGVLSHPAGHQGSFGDFAEAAADETAPEDPPLKTADQFTFIGDEKLPKLDTAEKSNGAAEFTLDVYRGGMLTAVVAHPNRFGATVASFDDSAARAVPGVVDVKQVSAGVAVLAENTYAALKGRKALSVEWDESAAESRDTETILSECEAAAQARGAIAHEAGDVDDALANAETVLEADFLFPYLAHAPMEPLDAVIERSADGGVEAWIGSQGTTLDHQMIANVCGVDLAQVKLHVMLAGGSFGRRAQMTSHLAQEAAEIFMAAGGDRAVKLMWTREDDIRGGYYRPVTVHHLRGGLDADGEIIAWEQTVAGQSFAAGTPFEAFMVRNGVDIMMVEGASETPYAVANNAVSAHIIQNPVSTLWWRSVGHTHTGYAVECFIDELLEAGGKDPVAGRLALMTDDYARLAGTLEKAAEIAGWGRDMPEGRALGVASVKSFNSYVSQVAEVSIEGGVPRVHKVWCAVDCGVAVNPEIIRAQMEGGIGYALSAILFNEITLDETGAVEQSNFHDYRSLRISEMPEVEVAIIASDEAPTGVGEPGVPPLGPAVANAVRRLTGAAPRRLPMIRNDFQA